MHIVDVDEAKTHFSKLIDFVMLGQEIFISVDGKTICKLSPILHKRKPRFGVLKGKIKIAKDFDAPLSLAETSRG